MSRTKQQIIKIDFDVAIEIWNKNNPDEPKMTRKKLFNLMTGKWTKTSLQNWKIGKVPEGFYKFYEIIQILGITEEDLKEIITIEKDGKTIKKWITKN